MTAFPLTALHTTASLWECRATSPTARDELVRRHLGLARALALRYRGGSPDQLEDLVQVANLGLVKAVDRFDPHLGPPFAAFATPTILGELRRHFRDASWSAHVPRGAKELSLEIQRAADELADSAGRSPTVLELAAYLGRTVEQVLQGLEAAQAHFATSLEAPVRPLGDGESDAGSLLDREGDEDEGFGLVEMSVSLRDALERLPYQEQRALRLRVGRDLTQSEVAREMGCSQMHVSRLLRRAAQNIREQVAL